MKEANWRTETDPLNLTACYASRASLEDRAFRRMAWAWLQFAGPQLTDNVYRMVLEQFEDVGRGSTPIMELVRQFRVREGGSLLPYSSGWAEQAVRSAMYSPWSRREHVPMLAYHMNALGYVSRYVMLSHAWAVAGQTPQDVHEHHPWHAHYSKAAEQARHIEAGLVRCILGNPFRPDAFSPAWRTSTVAAIASQMYESRDFGAMPILADALEEAGCENVNVLDHCRGEPHHVRGCWVVDRVLEKT